MSLYSYLYEQPQSPSDLYDQRIRRILIRSIATVFSLLIVLISSLLLKTIDKNSLVLSAQSISSISQDSQYIATNSLPTTTPTLTPTSYQIDTDRYQYGNLSPTPSPTIAISTNFDKSQSISAKSLYAIAIIGDSMVDTMGEVLEYLDSALKKKYPQTKFLLYNYGTGAQNVEAGLNRFSNHFKYQSRDYQSLPELKPDILIVGSFAYNPFTPHDRNNHWLTLTKVVQSGQTISSNVYMLAEIAPLRKDFGKGPQGVNWSDDSNYEHSGRIIEQLQNAVGLSKSLNIPLIDAFTPTFNSSSQEGNRSYVNPSDGIHPSVEGHQFMAEIIAQTLKLP